MVDEQQRATIYQRHADAVTREVAGETLVVPIRGHLADMRRIFSLNAVGALVWSELDGTRDVDALCHSVAGAFDVQPDEAATSIRAFLDELVDAGLADAVQAPGSATGRTHAGGGS